MRFVLLNKVEGYPVYVNFDRVLVMRADDVKRCTVLEMEGRFEKVVETPEQIFGLFSQGQVFPKAA